MTPNKRAEEHLELGLKYFEDPHNSEAALREFRRVIELEPTWATGYSNLSNALFDLGYLDEAAAASREAMRLSPEDAHHPIALGVILIQKNEFAKAIEVLRKGIQLKPQHFVADAYIWLAHALKESGQIEEAYRIWKLVADMEPTPPGYTAPQKRAKQMLEACDSK